MSPSREPIRPGHLVALAVLLIVVLACAAHLAGRTA